jgi:lipoate-protein ligase B
MREIRLERLPISDYNEVWRWQRQTADAVRSGAPEALALMQHLPVFHLRTRHSP